MHVTLSPGKLLNLTGQNYITSFDKTDKGNVGFYKLRN